MLTGDRVLLRPFRPADVEPLWRARLDPLTWAQTTEAPYARNLRRVHLQSLASNEPALRAYRAVGFVEEGRRREHAWVEGAYDDVVLLSVLRSEWRRCRRAPCVACADRSTMPTARRCPSVAHLLGSRPRRQRSPWRRPSRARASVDLGTRDHQHSARGRPAVAISELRSEIRG